MPFALLALDHVQLAMPAGEEPSAIAFYCGLLGMAQVPKPEPLASRGGVWLQAGSLTLHLGVEADFRPARKAHPGLTVRGIDDLAAALLAAGRPVRWDTDLPGVRRFHTDDPFGNRLELVDAG